MKEVHDYLHYSNIISALKATMLTKERKLYCISKTIVRLRTLSRKVTATYKYLVMAGKEPELAYDGRQQTRDITIWTMRFK